MQTAKVFFNGTEIIIPTDPLFYGGAVAYALDMLPTEEHIYTVVYVGQRESNSYQPTGTLWPGGPPVTPENGMSFEVAYTGRA